MDTPTELLCMAVSNGLIYIGNAIGYCGICKRIESSHLGRKKETLTVVRWVYLKSGGLRAIDADSRYLFGVGTGRFITVWDAQLRKEEVLVDAKAGNSLVKELTAVLGPARHKGVLLNSTTFYAAAVSTGNSGLIVAWDAGIRVAKGFCIAHHGTVSAMAHADMTGSPVVISTGTDRKTCVWNSASLDCIACLEGFGAANAQISSLISTPIGSFLSVSNDGWLRVWSFSIPNTNTLGLEAREANL